MLTLVVVSVQSISKIQNMARSHFWQIYTCSRKQIPEVEWNKQETQPLELPHRLAHICCQIPSLSPVPSYDQQCYQWFTGKLHCFMDTCPSTSAGESTESTNSAAKWSWVKDICPTRLHFLSLRRMWVSQESTSLDNRAPIEIWIWWWRNCNKNCRG